MAGLLPILVSVVIVSLVSFIGILTLSVKKKLLEKILVIIVALGAGTLIGGAVFELIPEAIELGGAASSLYITSGIILFFVIERFVHWHHHHTHGDHEQHHEGKIKPFAYLNLFGEAVHNFLDGTIIAASYLTSFELGLVSTIAIIFHEMPQEIGDFGILVYGGFPVRRALFYNFLIALTAVLGALVVFAAAGAVEGLSPILLAIAGGGFLYIALSNLIPEINKETNTKKLLASTIFLIIGVVLMYYLGIVFPE